MVISAMDTNVLPLTLSEVSENWQLLASLINEQSERALVIVATAKLETLIQDAVGKIAPSIDVGFGKNLRLLLGRGLVHSEVKECLLIVWNIRCHFAHSPNDCSLVDAKSAPLMKQLHSRLDASVGLLMEMLDSKLLEWEKAAGLPMRFKAAPEMRFFAGAAHSLALYLIAAKYLCPPPIAPPGLDNPTFKWGT